MGLGRVNTHSVSFTGDRGELTLILSVLHGIAGSERVSTRSGSFTWDRGELTLVLSVLHGIGES